MHVGHDSSLTLAQYPVQHVSVEVQDCQVFLQMRTSHEQSVAPGGHVTCPPLVLLEKHWRPLQQSPSLEQDCATSWHPAGGSPHTCVSGLHQSAGLQHGNDSEQAPLVSAQVGGGSVMSGAVHVPLVAPGSMSQVRGSPVVGSVVQQSAFVVQVPFFSTQELPPPRVAQLPVPSVASHHVEQH